MYSSNSAFSHDGSPLAVVGFGSHAAPAPGGPVGVCPEYPMLCVLFVLLYSLAVPKPFFAVLTSNGLLLLLALSPAGIALASARSSASRFS